MTTRCQGLKADGSGCRKPPAKGSKFCLFHDPDKVMEAQAIRSRGGTNTKGTGPILDIGNPRTESELLDLASSVTGAVARREIDNKTADTIVKLVKTQLQVIKQRREQMPEISDNDIARMTEEELVVGMEEYCARYRKEQEEKHVDGA